MLSLRTSSKLLTLSESLQLKAVPQKVAVIGSEDLLLSVMKLVNSSTIVCFQLDVPQNSHPTDGLDNSTTTVSVWRNSSGIRLWLPYILIGISFVLFLAVHFWCYHKRNRERYLRKCEEQRLKCGLLERRRIATLMMARNQSKRAAAEANAQKEDEIVTLAYDSRYGDNSNYLLEKPQEIKMQTGTDCDTIYDSCSLDVPTNISSLAGLVASKGWNHPPSVSQQFELINSLCYSPPDGTSDDVFSSKTDQYLWRGHSVSRTNHHIKQDILGGEQRDNITNIKNDNRTDFIQASEPLPPLLSSQQARPRICSAPNMITIKENTPQHTRDKRNRLSKLHKERFSLATIDPYHTTLDNTQTGFKHYTPLKQMESNTPSTIPTVFQNARYVSTCNPISPSNDTNKDLSTVAVDEESKHQKKTVQQEQFSLNSNTSQPDFKDIKHNRNSQGFSDNLQTCDKLQTETAISIPDMTSAIKTEVDDANHADNTSLKNSSTTMLLQPNNALDSDRNKNRPTVSKTPAFLRSLDPKLVYEKPKNHT